MSETYYPPSSFYFSVSVLGALTLATMLTSVDSSFQEISGIEAEFDVEEVAEGGENRFLHRLPKHTKFSPLVLKRGVVTKSSALGEWVSATIGSRLSIPIVPQNLLVMLLGADGTPKIVWLFVNAYPLKWRTDALSSMDSKVLVESL